MSLNRKKMKRSRTSSEESSSSSMSSSQTASSDEETDAKDMKPIKEYLVNRKELASQLFKSVKAEKIRMMLPQLLKKVELSELEELCVSELSGMSKARIMCIINGQEMLQSSDTDDSDDSGPSLEIISDTEWLSDVETNIKLEGSNTQNNKNSSKLKKSQNLKKQDLKSKMKLMEKQKLGKDNKSSVKVKLEKTKIETKEKIKEKEGESLLDLLELEMRARAIRALIRKEEDTSSNSKYKNVQSNNFSNIASGSGTSNDKNVKVRQANLKEQLEKIDVLMKHGDDEDVFVVIQPAPTIELLSSESEADDNSKRVNQKFVNERKSEDEQGLEKEKLIKNKESDKGKEIILNKEKDNILKDTNKSKDAKKEKDTNNENSKNGIEKTKENLHTKYNLPISVIESTVNDNTETLQKSYDNVDLEEGEIVDNDDEAVEHENIAVTDTFSSVINKIKKVKKNLNIRTRKMMKENNDAIIKSNIQDSVNELYKCDIHTNQKEKEKDANNVLESIEINESSKTKIDSEKILKVNSKEITCNPSLDMFDEKSLDIEEIINLDDYPDDMDDMELNENNKEKQEDDKVVTTNNIGNVKMSFNSETWATRYYQQDHVQNVIKESKIQSEIRKRLRERQRQKKMNQLPKVKDHMISQSSPEPLIVKSTGSVEEYLALKGISNDTSNSGSQENTESCDSLNLTKKNDSLLTNNLNSTIEKQKSLLNISESPEKSLTSSHVYENSEKQVTIPKKPKLFDHTKDIDVNTPVEDNLQIKLPQIHNPKQQNSLINSENAVLSNVDSISINQSVILSTELNKVEHSHTKIDFLPLRGDMLLPKSDSSDDDGVIVRIDNMGESKLCLEQPKEIENEQKGQKIISNIKSYDLQPD